MTEETVRQGRDGMSADLGPNSNPDSPIKSEDEDLLMDTQEAPLTHEEATKALATVGAAVAITATARAAMDSRMMLPPATPGSSERNPSPDTTSRKAPRPLAPELYVYDGRGRPDTRVSAYSSGR